MGSLLKTLSKKILVVRRKINNPAQSDLNNVSQNNPDPRTSKPILETVLQSDKFIVTIDNALSVNWTTKGDYKDYAKDFSAVTSKVQLLSVQIDELFANKVNRYKYKKIIAEALALVLDEKESGNALALLKEVENRIKEYGRERVRIAYIFYASLATALIAILIGTFVHYKNSNWLFEGNTNLYQICIATFMGGIGAFISTLFRFKNYEGNIFSGLSAHRLDGFLRILYGCIAALVLGLAIYSNTILGFLNNIDHAWVIYFLATIAGASEFLMPNLVRSTPTTEKENETKSIFKEKEVTDNIDKNKLAEKVIVPHENTEYGDNILLYKKKAEPEGDIEDETGKEEQAEERIITYEDIGKDDDILLNKSAESANKQDNEIKIPTQLVQGKMNLQDY